MASICRIEGYIEFKDNEAQAKVEQFIAGAKLAAAQSDAELLDIRVGGYQERLERANELGVPK